MDDYALAKIGHAALTKPSLDVGPNEDVSELIAALKNIMAQYDGLGISAPQVGVNKRVAVMQLGTELVVAINLRIVERSEQREMSAKEGCLSIQTAGIYFRTDVMRRKWVTIHYEDPSRKPHNKRLAGLEAQIAQHEHDHLDGKLIVDGLPRHRRRQILHRYGART
jgi:peptide deformylase